LAIRADTCVIQGQNIIFTLANGAEFEGIYASNPADAASCFLRMVQQKKGPNSADISNGAVKRDNMSFQRKDIADARALSSNNAGKNDGRTTNGRHRNMVETTCYANRVIGNRGGFRTDAAISNSRGPIGRDLQRWEPDTKDVDPNMSLERSSGVWDQFATNERLFGLKTDYDETIYTTAIDTAHPAYRQRVALADRTAREIEKSAPVTSHVAEERQMDFVGGADDRNEEDKYVARTLAFVL
jgi:PAB1-binding protein PBP1